MNEIDLAQDNPITTAMERAGISKEVIWDRLGEGNDFDNIKDQLNKAKELAQEEEEALIGRIKNYLGVA